MRPRRVLETLGFRVGDHVRCRRRRSHPGRIVRFERTLSGNAVAVAEGSTYVFTADVGELEYVVLDQLAQDASTG